MTQTTTNVGRLGLADPDLGYDTLDGGTSLHTVLRTNWTTVANHLMHRYFEVTSLPNGSASILEHFFDLNLSKIKVYIFEGGNQLTTAQLVASYTVTEDDTNSIRVENISGVTKTFQVVIYGGRLGIETTDIGPDISIDTTGNIRAAELRAIGNSLVLNHDATSTAADWKGTISRPSTGMAADAVWTMPTSTQTIVGRDNTETLQNKTFTSTGPITHTAGAAIDWAAGNVSIGASIGANTLTIGGATTSILIPGTLQTEGLSVRNDDIDLNVDATQTGADWKVTLRRPLTGMTTNTVVTFPSISTTIVGRNTTDTLLNKSMTSAIVTDYMKYTHTTTPATPGAGTMLIYAKSDDKFYTLNSAGVETAVGSGSGSGGINYISESDFETTANGATPTGWVAYADAAAATPVDGTGGSPNAAVTFLASTTSPIRGLVSAIFTKDAANRQGTGWSKAFTIASPDKGLKHQLSFEMDASSNYVADDMRVYIYDVTNSVLITPSTVAIPKLTNGKWLVTFDATTSLSYRLILHIASVSALAYTVKFDSFLVNAEKSGMSAASGDWTAYTPVWTSSATQPAIGNGSLTGFWRRDACDILVRILLNSGTTTTWGTGTYYFTLPSGMVGKPSLLGGINSLEGGCTVVATVTANVWDMKPCLQADGVRVAALKEDGAAASDLGSTVPTSFTAATASQRIEFINLRVPIVGWESSGINSGAGAQVEYASNSGNVTTANGADTTSFLAGSNGTPILAYNSTTANATTDFRVQFANPVQADDLIILEVYDGNGWYAADRIFPWTYLNTSIYGMTMILLNPTQARVSFGNQGSRTALAATYAASGQAWSAFSTYRWRVRKVKASSPVGFGLATATESGLVSTTTQTWVGDKTLTGSTTIGPSGGLGGSTPGLTVRGGNLLGGSNAADAAIKIGNNAAYGGVIQFSDVSSTTLYIDSLFDSASAKTQFRMRTAGTPINVGEVTGAGQWTIGSTTGTHVQHVVQSAGETQLRIISAGATNRAYLSLVSTGVTASRIRNQGGTAGLEFSNNSDVVTGGIQEGGGWSWGKTTGTSGDVHVMWNLTTTSATQICQFRKGANDSTPANVFIAFLHNGGNTGCGQINANSAGQAAFGSFSDIRLKKNIKNLPSQLGNIMGLRPVEFDYKDGSGHQTGYIAQEMQKIYPDAVAEREDKMLTITGWDKTSARLVKAIQEQQQIIEKLMTRIEALEKK